MPAIRPDDLPAAVSVAPTVALIIDNGVTVEKATPLQLTDAATPLASQAEAEAGVNNTNRMTPLRASQAIDAQIKDPLAANGGSQLVTFTRSETNALPQNTEVKLSNLRSVSDISTPALADANGGTLFTPTNIASTVANGAALAANYWGPAQITTADTNKRGKWFSNVTAPPSAIGDQDSINTAFNGDWSKSLFPVEHRISGATTLGQPVTGYMYTPETSPFYGVMESSSGHNQSTSSNVGRTAATFFRTVVRNYGQGDVMAYNAAGFVSGAKPGATHFLANPAVALFCGDIAAGSNGVYLNPREIICHDNGYDVACVGDVINFNRTNGTGALSVYWGAYRAQNQGSVAPDNVLSAAGEWKFGLDFSMANFGTNKAAISLAANHRIYFNNSSSNAFFTTSVGTYWMEYSSGASALNFVANNTSALQISHLYLNMLVPPKIPVTVSSSLPAASIGQGVEYYVTDANSTTRFATLVGGGANRVKVASNGTNWIIQ